MSWVREAPQGPDGQTRAVGPTVDRRVRSPPEALLSLQAVVGNSAVLDMLAIRPIVGGRPGAECPPVISRQDADGPAAPAGMTSRVVEGLDHYRYKQFANGDIAIVAGPARVGEMHVKGSPVNTAITAEIERTAGPFPAAAPAPEVQASPPGGGADLLPSFDAILNTLGGVGGAGIALIDDLTGLVRSALGLGDGSTGPTASPDADPRAGGTSTPSDSPAGEPVANNTDVDANLAEAKKLADELKIGHSYDHDGLGKHGADETVVADKLKGGLRRDAIIGGDADQLQTILCSEFTNLTLAKMGVDLAQRYLVPGEDRLPLGYPEKGSVTFLTLFMVTNNQIETTAALIDHQNQLSRRVVAGSQEATDLGCRGEPDDFFVVDRRDSLEGLAVSNDNEFGAGATAVALGGRPVDPADRKPGDLQQAVGVDSSGLANGRGHSSQVWTVFGDGVACLGKPGSPTVAGGTVSTPGPLETLSGWYELPPGPLKWEVGPTTDPALVAKLTCVEFQLIEANVGNANDDATGVGEARVDKSEVVSNGRLPDSKWFAWQARDQSVSGTLA